MFLFVQRFAALDIILQSLYHALCTFSGPYKCGLLAIFINFVFVLVFLDISYHRLSDSVKIEFVFEYEKRPDSRAPRDP